MEQTELEILLNRLVAMPTESECVEFKHNFHTKEEIGERISALSNSAALLNLPYGYLVFGIEDGSHNIVGTSFKCRSHKVGNEELELWLVNRLNPRLDLECIEFDYNGNPKQHISMYRIPAATDRPVSFLNTAYIRIGSLTKKLMGYPEKEAKLWKRNNNLPLNAIVVLECKSANEVVSQLSAETYFDRLNIPMPSTVNGIVDKFISEKFVIPTELGYGDAVQFVQMLDWINGQLPANEEIGRALRKDVRMYPEKAIREIVANMIIHQNFAVQGFPMVEIYSDRVEISSPGQPLISTDRFIDEYQSRNDELADIMRRMGFCEEKGSGMDKALAGVEEYQLPPIKYRVSDIRTTVILSEYKGWAETTKEERIQACYQHACLKYMSNEMMTNKSFRERMGVEEKNYPMVSIVIREAVKRGLIKVGTPEGTNRRDVAYIPSWG